jgi:signal peptide peptidase SppA
MDRHELMRVFAEPLAIEERCFRALEAYAVRVLSGQDHQCAQTLASAGIRPPSTIVAAGPEAAAANQGGNVPGAEYDLIGSCAIIHVWGVLDKKDPTSKGRRVGTGYERVAATVEAARHDDRVGVILLNIDSPGGAVRGVNIGADAIFNAAESGRTGGKPVYAFAGDLMASAALYLGSQADKVYGGPGVWAGSLGVRMMTVDYSQALSREGIRVNTIKSGEFKDLGNPYREMTERDRAQLQGEVNDYFGLFKQAVVRGRRMSMDQVNTIATGEGFIGEKAVKAGLIDAIRGSMSELAAELSDKHPAPRHGAGRGGARNSAKGHAMELTAGQVNGAAGGTTGTASTGATGANASTGGSTGTGNNGTTGNGGSTGTAQPAATPLSGDQIAGHVADALGRLNQRNAEIHSLCAPYAHLEGVVALRDKAVLDPGATVQSVQAALLPVVTKASSPVGTIDLQIGASGWERERGALEAVLINKMAPGTADLMRRNNPAAVAVIAAWGAQLAIVSGGCAAATFATPEAYTKALKEAQANGLGRMRLMDVAERCAGMALYGQPSRRQFQHDDQILAAAFGHSSSDFPSLLANVSQKVLMRYFAETPVTWDKWAAVGDSTDFKPTSLVTLSELPDLKIVPEGGPLQEATFNERKASVSVLTRGRKTSVTRETMINDDLSGFQKQWQLWGMAAQRGPEALAYGLLNGNGVSPSGNNLFSSGNANILSGSSAGVLSRASVVAAYKLIRLQKGFGKDKPPLDIHPRNLLAPVALWDVANEVIRSVVDPTRTIANLAAPNTVQYMNLNEPITSPYLDALSSIKWYLLGDQNQAPTIQLNFLRGNRNPIVTQVGNGSVRGVEFEILFDFGGAIVNHEGAAMGDGT